MTKNALGPGLKFGDGPVFGDGVKFGPGFSGGLIPASRECDHCRTSLFGRRVDARYCGSKCRSAARRSRLRDVQIGV